MAHSYSANMPLCYPGSRPILISEGIRYLLPKPAHRKEDSQVEVNRVHKTLKRLIWPSIALAALVSVALAGRAGASSISSAGPGIPPPQPTVPPTAGQRSPTPDGTSVPTSVATATRPRPRPTAPATAPACNMPFTDVHTSDWFYAPVAWMYCNGIVSGYADNTFRPNNPTTRGQMVKIAMGAFPLSSHTEGGPHFADVPTTDPFYTFVETANYYSIVSGYPCGGLGEPCDDRHRPYFHPSSQVTRGQLTKIVVFTAVLANPTAWRLTEPPVPTFADVAHGSTFYIYVETAVVHNLLQGYACGGDGEPCPGRYFRLGRNATRAQLSKIVYGAVTQP